MGVAIKNGFPNTRHHLCEWHIEKNVVKKIPHLLQQFVFRRYFNKLLWKCEFEGDFQFTWYKMVDEFNVGDNDWLKSLHGLKENGVQHLILMCFLVI